MVILFAFCYVIVCDCFSVCALCALTKTRAGRFEFKFHMCNVPFRGVTYLAVNVLKTVLSLTKSNIRQQASRQKDTGQRTVANIH